MKNNEIIKLTYYKGYLILTLLDNNSPKVSIKGSGQSCLDFNSTNMIISKDALECLEMLLSKTKVNEYVALEFISKTNIWWMSKNGGIILNLTDSSVNVHQIPVHTLCDNNIDEKLIQYIENN